MKLALAVLAAVALAVGHSQGLFSGKSPSDAGSPKALPTISITTPQVRDLPLELSAQGHLVALNQVDVRAQVAGVIRTVEFHEGDSIRQGQLLFTLDNTETLAVLRRAEANSAQVQAQLDDAVRAEKRAGELLNAKFVSQSAVDTAVSKSEALRAQLKAANAEIDTARAQAGYTRIVSSLSGKAGALNVHPGSLATPTSATPLVTIAQFDPIGVEFSLPEGNLGAVLAAKASSNVKVAIETPDGQRVEGQLTFINNTVATGTGTINLKASLPNPRQTLWPGAYVRTTIFAGVTKDAMVLPPAAILEGPSGRFVYVLDANGKVASKPVTLVRVLDQRAVVDGLAPNDRVVLDGNHAVAPGASVQVVNAPAVASTP